MTIAVFIHTLLFLVFWLTNLSFQQEVNNFLADATGLKINFLLVFIIFTLAVGVWSAIRLMMRKRSGKFAHRLFYGIGGFYLVFFYGSFIILFLKNPIQLPRLGQFILYFRIFLDTAILFFVAWILRTKVKRPVTGWKKWIPLFGLVVLWMIPVFWTPGNVYRGSLPRKPLLIAHRGASQLAPENTLASMKRAAELGVYGVEADIIMSRDGTLFLMHDSNLVRTTNVAIIFPDRVKDPADSFTWDELAQLNAGAWFVTQDPFHTVASGRVSADDAIYFLNEPIPSLSEILQIVKDNNLHFIFDLRIPSGNHPYAAQTLDMCLSEIKAAGVTSRTWVLTGLDDIPAIRAVLPDAILAAGIDYSKAPAPEQLGPAGYQVVNSEYGLSNRMIRIYHRAFWVNLWTVDEPWQYSRLWLAGADSVTSNNIKALIALPAPVMAMRYTTYIFLWVVAGIGSAVVGFMKRVNR
jgi:glycerophosphoryl diester phosphodiesterase